MTDATGTPKVQSILHTLKNAEAIRVDGSPLLTDFHDEEGEIVFQWVDDESNVFSVTIEHGDLEDAALSLNTLETRNAEGEPVTVEVFSLTPSPFPDGTPSDHARFIKKVMQFGKLDHEELIEILDDLVYSAVGDYEASRINNQGPEEQVKALVQGGHKGMLIDALSARTGLKVELLAW